jgi:hypothetical protein
MLCVPALPVESLIVYSTESFETGVAVQAGMVTVKAVVAT